ncbi:hypothetical protein [Hellea balneolensis]|uniref:hypothetical protein n=1 Tax=Hellea balneolensis TaxID=287478 RepID=UPI0004020A0A|nr:hypothetical protein [Hellea balneolensis]
MAKSKTTAKKATKTTQKEAVKATALLRKGVLAYVGLHGAAYERAKFRFEQVRTSTDGLFDTFVEKGEELEAKAADLAKVAQVKASETFTDTTAKVRGVMPTASNDRVSELEAEVTALNKKIAAMTKKATKPVKKVKMTTEKTVTKAA